MIHEVEKGSISKMPDNYISPNQWFRQVAAVKDPFWKI